MTIGLASQRPHRPARRGSTARCLAVILAIPTVILGCSKENVIDDSVQVRSGLGAQCSGTDDPGCGVAAICVLGLCRSGCTTDAECPRGTLCIGDTPPFGCQLPGDAVCNDTDKRCKPPLICGLDKTCRMPCQKSKDCPRNEHECHAGVCVGDAEKGAAATAYRSCSDGDTRCGDGQTFCVDETCEVQACNEVAPGWAVVETCQGESATCESGKCRHNVSSMALVRNPKGGTYGIDVTEVTRLQYAKFMQAKGDDVSGQLPECSWNTTWLPYGDWPPADRLHHPVGSVDWCDAYAYCKWAGKRLCGRIWGGPNAYDDYADATRSQWYNACSSGGQRAYPYGNEYQGDSCNGLDRHAAKPLAAGYCPNLS